MKWATTILIFCVAVLIGLGLVMLYSSSMNMEVARKARGAAKTAATANAGSTAPRTLQEVGAAYLLSQCVWLAFGLVGCVVAARVDYRRWKKISPFLLIASAFLLLLVFAPVIGIGRKGAHRWIGLPGLPHFQPSELAKLSLILFLAAYADRFQRQMPQFRRGLVIPGCIIAAVLGLIFIEPDRGCTILLAAVSGAMLIVAGVRLSYLVLPALALAGGLAVSFMHDPMRLRRIMAWWNPDANASREGAGYQAYQAMIALGSGGWTGLGLGNGRQKLDFVPEHHTDFIFSIIGEELGLVATMAVVLLFIAVVMCGIYIARRSNDTFGLLVGTGITVMIGLQAIINMGVVTSMLPNKGMPLPFISYGGSNLLLMLIATGLLLSISRFAVEPPKRKINPFESTPELAEADA